MTFLGALLRTSYSVNCILPRGPHNLYPTRRSAWLAESRNIGGQLACLIWVKLGPRCVSAPSPLFLRKRRYSSRVNTSHSCHCPVSRDWRCRLFVAPPRRRHGYSGRGRRGLTRRADLARQLVGAVPREFAASGRVHSAG